ncbi:membrane protein [Actinocatenispora thailandica]|uniref:Membrane protein n=1 Tax=Actinocatenispora thailandica TaxID=227318 RepID=A0A7R7HV38_9ACTN|nr:zf-HC2 domain-containing protein [Actinocatenispora thailandica]BCJ32509.1 membrane protein [Actinocatenispora thailandica]
MECEQCRTALSARLDGEAEPAPAGSPDQHLAGCAACRSWYEQATRLSRRLRVRPAVSGPDLTDRVLTAAWPPGGGSRRRWRIALAVVAAAQLALGLAQLLGWHAGMMPAAGHDLSTHLFDESTAWNLALGLGMASVAWRARAAAGLIPVVGGFLVVLTAFCVRDLAAGTVTAMRVSEHGLLLLGFTLMLLVRRAATSGTRGPTAQPGDTTGAGPHRPAGPDRPTPLVPPAAPGRGLRSVNHRRAA